MLKRGQKYLQIALNRSFGELAEMIGALPMSDKVIIEAGYPLVKTYGVGVIRAIKSLWEEKIFGYASGGPANLMPGLLKEPGVKIDILEALIGASIVRATGRAGKREPFRKAFFNPYIVADLKCMDRAFAEVEAAASAGASAVTCLGLAPTETVNEFIKRCKSIGIDSVLDMMNIEYPFEILGGLAELPTIVMLHRGVDEGEESKDKEMPHQEIEKIKGVYDDILVAVAGGEDLHDVLEGAFNGADIVIVWKAFNENPQKVAAIANEFLREIK